MKSRANNQPTNGLLLFDDTLMILFVWNRTSKNQYQTTNKNQTKNKQLTSLERHNSHFNNKKRRLCPGELLPPSTHGRMGIGM